ncbi:MAG: hypothetical protein ACAH10_03825 [Methylophilaceae bacterium]
MSEFKNSHKPLDEKGYLSTSLASISSKPARSLQKPVWVVVILLLVVGFTFYR